MTLVRGIQFSNKKEQIIEAWQSDGSLENYIGVKITNPKNVNAV